MQNDIIALRIPRVQNIEFAQMLDSYFGLCDYIVKETLANNNDIVPFKTYYSSLWNNINKQFGSVPAIYKKQAMIYCYKHIQASYTLEEDPEHISKKAYNETIIIQGKYVKLSYNSKKDKSILTIPNFSYKLSDIGKRSIKYRRLNIEVESERSLGLVLSQEYKITSIKIVKRISSPERTIFLYLKRNVKYVQPIEFNIEYNVPANTKLYGHTIAYISSEIEKAVMRRLRTLSKCREIKPDPAINIIGNKKAPE